VIKYYSQSGEDCLLWQFFGERKSGFYVDVGAFDGVLFSNTLSFEEQGWSGICVEPLATFYNLCRQARPNSTCLNLACVADKNVQTVRLYTERLGLFSGTQGHRVADVQSAYQVQGLSFTGFDQTVVPALTLDAILYEYAVPGQEIDFVSIDVEGTELDVLRGFDLARFCPRVVVVEANSDRAEGRITAHMSGFGFLRAGRLGVNTFYARERADAARLRTLTVTCELERVAHPTVQNYQLQNQERYVRAAHLDKTARPGRRSVCRRMGRRVRRLLGRVGWTNHGRCS